MKFLKAAKIICEWIFFIKLPKISFLCWTEALWIKKCKLPTENKVNLFYFSKFANACFSYEMWLYRTWQVSQAKSGEGGASDVLQQDREHRGHRLRWASGGFWCQTIPVKDSVKMFRISESYFCKSLKKYVSRFGRRKTCKKEMLCFLWDLP